MSYLLFVGFVELLYLSPEFSSFLKPATSDYVVRDTGNCSPRYMRCTINQVTMKHRLFDGRMCFISIFSHCIL